MPKLTVDGIEVEVPAGATVLQAAEAAGKEIPRFCYHERLSIAGNCRMCLVEVKPGPPKPQASCALPAADGQEIRTDTPMVKKAREGVMEFLLINHPLDCPICDQGGECDLQDQAMAFGRGHSRYDENKRAVTEKYMGPIVKTAMTRCIQCTRCVRFAEEVAGVEDLGALYRGEAMQITTYLEHAFKSELSGNVVDLCPVGALTSKPYAFEARPWELKKTPAIDVMDAVGTNIMLQSRGRQVLRALPRVNDDVNEEWASDKTRHAIDGLVRGRLDRPYVRRAASCSPRHGTKRLPRSSRLTRASRVAAIAGDLVDCETMYAAKALLRAMGSDLLEGRQTGLDYDCSSLSAVNFNTGIADIERADAILLIGTNPRFEAPLVNTRIRKAVRRGAKVFTVGPNVDLTYKHEWLGSDAGLAGQAARCSARSLRQGRASGGDRRRRGAEGQGRAWRRAGAGQDAQSGARRLERLQRPAHGRQPYGRADARLCATGRHRRYRRGGCQSWCSCSARTRSIVRKLTGLKVYVGHHGDKGAHAADVILPAASYAEKPGTYVNLEGRVQRSERAVFPPGDAREDWTILRALSDVLGPHAAVQHARRTARGDGGRSAGAGSGRAGRLRLVRAQAVDRTVGRRRRLADPGFLSDQRDLPRLADDAALFGRAGARR